LAHGFRGSNPQLPGSIVFRCGEAEHHGGELVMEQSCSPHDGQEVCVCVQAQDPPFKGTSQGPTSSNQAPPPPSPFSVNSSMDNPLVTLAPHDPITCQQCHHLGQAFNT
jgi:hypothetical protein